MTNYNELTMENFAKGAATELFERELEKVVENIDDLNTKADSPREITLKFVIKPSVDRDNAVLSVESKSKVAPVKCAVGQTVFARKNGKLTAYANDINQLDLNIEGNLTPVQSKEA